MQKALRKSKEEIRVIYHSHPDAPAIFSQEDQQKAVWQNEPVYPGVNYLVISVIKGKATEACLYGWDPLKKDFNLIEKVKHLKHE